MADVDIPEVQDVYVHNFRSEAGRVHTSNSLFLNIGRNRREHS